MTFKFLLMNTDFSVGKNFVFSYIFFSEYLRSPNVHPAFFYFLKKGEKIIQLEMRVYIFYLLMSICS